MHKSRVLRSRFLLFSLPSLPPPRCFTISIQRTAGERIKQKIMLFCFPFYHIQHLTQAIRKQLKASVSTPHPVQILALILFSETSLF